MSLKHDYFRFYWAVVTEKTFNQCLCKGISYTILDKSAFSPVMISSKSNTNTNE